MANDDSDMRQQVKLESDVRDMQLKEEGKEVDMNSVPPAMEIKKDEPATPSDASTPAAGSFVKQQSQSPVKMAPATDDAIDKPGEETIGGDVELKLEPGKAPKLMRKASQKVERRPAPLFDHYEDSTAEATSKFSLLTECIYGNKYMGSTEPALECDCSEEWNAATRSNDACGEDSDCINRATKMECSADCGCGDHCQNQRFLRKQWADVSVIKTEKKGYGLRTNVNLRAHDFIFEYVGEVVSESAFMRRRQVYHDEGIIHFYFMSLSKGEFVDATKKGNLGRFCNHSCNPNCYVDKWVVGDKLRMGIFAERKIKAGEELVFNYNVDRYGADPQPCYCDEPNCTGFIGGRTQTERATKLSHATIEALGIDDADAWDTAVARRPRKKKISEDDEEYVNNFEPRGLDEEGVNKVMSSLMQCKEKWIAVKLLARIQRAEDEKVRNRVVRFHGYRVLKTALSNFKEDVNVCLQILDVLDKMPRLTLNKIRGSKIEETIQELIGNENEKVAAQSRGLLESWSNLKMEYRIPKRDPKDIAAERKIDRRDGRRSRSRTRSKSPEPIHAPTGPRHKAPQRNASYLNNGPRPPPRFRPPPPGALPPGWFAHTAQNGSVYYYNQAGTTTWQRPTMPAVPAPPPPPSKAQTDQQMLQDLIQSIVSTKKEPAKPGQSADGTPTDTPKKDRKHMDHKEEKWRSMPEEKQKKIYESTLQPHIMHVVGKYKHKLAKDDLKRWAKELAKKLVDSDFRKGRVENPSKVSDKQAKGVKKHAQEFFDKALKKKEAADRKRAERKAKQGAGDESHTPSGSPSAVPASPAEKEDVDDPVSDDEADEAEATPAGSTHSSSALKRRHDELANGLDEDQSPKKQRTDDDAAQSPPPPPPPPPPPVDGEPMTEDQPTLTPDEDVSGSFTHEAIAAVHAATFDHDSVPDAGKEDVPMDAGDSATDRYDAAPNGSLTSDRGGHLKDDLMQMATPPTTGSPYLDEAQRAAKGLAASSEIAQQ